MLAVLQRVSEASVTIEENVKGRIGQGLLILLGITHTDGPEDVEWLAKKLVNMRIFGDAEGKMNLALPDGAVIVEREKVVLVRPADWGEEQ